MRIRDLRPGMKHVDIKVRILSLSEPIKITSREGVERQLVEAQVGDSTGTSVLALWNERVGSVNVDDVMQIRNGFVTSFKGEVRLNVGKYGEMAKIEDPLFPKAEHIPRK